MKRDLLTHQAYFKLKQDIDTWKRGEPSCSLIVIGGDCTTNCIDYLSSACHCVKKWGTVQKTQQESLSFEWTLLSRVDLFKPACTLIIVVHLIFRHSFGCSLCLFWDSRGNNCFYFFIFNPCSINTPGYMTHQPLAIPHKETGLFGATTIWFWGGAVWFHSFPPLLTGVFQGRLWVALHNAVRRGFVRT